jgi:hypothetical protein
MSGSIVNLILQLVAGAAGGNLAGSFAEAVQPRDAG